MKQIFPRFKKLFLLATMVVGIACTLNACSKTKEASTEEMSTVDSTSMTTEMPVTVQDSLPPIDTTAKTRPDGTNN